MLGMDGRVTPEGSAQIHRLLGLDEPLPQQFGHWLWDALHGNLEAGRGGAAATLPVTIELVGLSMALAVSGGFRWVCRERVFHAERVHVRDRAATGT
jgi:ABC-type dipeptide/oligopeptide/nickel transport system permease component